MLTHTHTQRTYTAYTHTHIYLPANTAKINNLIVLLPYMYMNSCIAMYAFYRERLLLVDPDNSPAASKQLVALVVGHELAHQWFGNLVS